MSQRGYWKQSALLFSLSAKLSDKPPANELYLHTIKQKLYLPQAARAGFRFAFGFSAVTLT